jgi:hypothetical protein
MTTTRTETDNRPFWVGLGLLVFTVLGILVNRRPFGDIALMVFGGLVIIGVVLYYVIGSARRSAAERRRRAREERRQAEEDARRMYEEMARWESFTRDDGAVFQAGVHRVPRGGFPAFSERVLSDLPADAPLLQRIEKEGEAIARAREFNELAGL